MSIRWMFYLSLALCWGCASQQTRHKEQTRLNRSTSYQLALKWVKERVQMAHLWQIEKQRDSFRLLIYPKGVFSYHPQQGFKGEALVVQANGISQQLNAGAMATTVSQTANGKVVAGGKQSYGEVKSHSELKKWSKPMWRWLGGLALFCGVVGFWWFKKRWR